MMRRQGPCYPRSSEGLVVSARPPGTRSALEPWPMEVCERSAGTWTAGHIYGYWHRIMIRTNDIRMFQIVSSLVTEHVTGSPGQTVVRRHPCHRSTHIRRRWENVSCGLEEILPDPITHSGARSARPSHPQNRENTQPLGDLQATGCLRSEGQKPSSDSRIVRCQPTQRTTLSFTFLHLRPISPPGRQSDHNLTTSWTPSKRCNLLAFKSLQH